MKKGYIILLVLFFGMIPLKNLHAEQVVKISNVDNFIMHKYLNKGGIYSKLLEDVMNNGIVETGILGTGWGNKKQIDKFSLVEKVIKDPEAKAYGLEYLGKNRKITKVIYPYENRGWTDVHLANLDGSREIVLEIEGGSKDPIHQWVGNIGIKRPDGTIEDIPVNIKGAFDKEKVPALILSDDYFYYRKEKGDIKELLDKELGWKDGFQILVIRKMLERVSGDERFGVLVNPGGDINYNDTVLIRISLDKGKFSESNPPTILIGWKNVKEVDEGGDSKERD